MSYVEIQLDVPTLLSFVGIGIGGSLAAQVGTQITVGGTEYTIIQVTQGNATLLPAVPENVTVYYDDGFGDAISDTLQGSFIALNQPVSYRLTTSSGAVQTIVGPIAFDVTLNVSMSGGLQSIGPPIQYSTPQLTIVFGNVTGDGTNPALATALANLIEGAIQPVSESLPIGNFGSACNVGAAVDTTGTVVALRMQLGLVDKDYVIGLWNLFYRGTGITNYLLSAGATTPAPAAVFLTSDLVIANIQNNIQNGVAQHGDTFGIQGGITTPWPSTATDGVHLTSSFTGIIYTGNITVGIDIGTDLTVATGQNVVANTIQSHSHVTWSVNLADEIAAAFVAGVITAFTGAELTGGLGALPGFVIGAAAVFMAVAAYTPNLSAPSCTQSGSDVTCTWTVAVPSLPPSTQPLLQFASVCGYPEGMAMQCQLNLPGVIPTVSLGTCLRIMNFNSKSGLRSLETSVIDTAYLKSQDALKGLFASL